jgi:uncharacterized ferredoxin-like protein
LTSTISESLIKAVVMDLNCNVCGFETCLKNDLAKHVKTMHSGVNDFQCDKCDYQTSTPQRLTIHVNNLHVKGSKCSYEECDYACTAVVIQVF